MEDGAEPRNRTFEGENTCSSSSSHCGIREGMSTDRAVSPGSGTKPMEKKREHHSSRSSIVPTSHRSSHPSSGGALDLQAAIGRSGSSISGMTVPIRLDALSYLLNSAVTGNRMPSQTPHCPPTYPMCSYPQMGCSPCGMCMGPQFCPSNQYPAYQTGFMPYGSHQSMQMFQQQVPNITQGMSGASQNQNQGPFSGVNPQSGMAFNPTGMAFNPTGMAFTATGMASNSTGMAFNPIGMAPNSTGMGFNPIGMTSNSTGMAFNSAENSSGHNSNGTGQLESTSWGKKPNEKASCSERFGGNERSGNNWSNFSESENQNSPRRGFGRFRDKKNDDGWSSRQQSNSFGRDFSRGRGNFGGSSWRGNSRGQDKEWTFGDRSRNVDFGSKRRFGGESPERFEDRGSFSKRGRWPGGRGRGGQSPDPCQQKNRQKDSPAWPSAVDTPNTSTMALETKTAVTSNAGDEDWESDYPVETAASKLGDPSVNPEVQSPVPCSPKNNCNETVDDSIQVEAIATSPEVEEPPTDSSSGKDTAIVEPEAKEDEEDSALGPVIPSEQDQQEDEIYSFIVTVDGEENKSVLLEVVGENL